MRDGRRKLVARDTVVNRAKQMRSQFWRCPLAISAATVTGQASGHSSFRLLKVKHTRAPAPRLLSKDRFATPALPGALSSGGRVRANCTAEKKTPRSVCDLRCAGTASTNLSVLAHKAQITFLCIGA